MAEEKVLTMPIKFEYQSDNDSDLINEQIETLLNSNRLVSEQFKKMNIYRTEFYNLFFEPKTKWLIKNNHMRLYIREDYLSDDKNLYTHYIPIGYITNTEAYKDRYENIHKGEFYADIYPEITAKFKDLFTKKGDLNTDRYSKGYICCDGDIVAITLKHLNTKYESKDAFMIHCNKLVKFAKEYINENGLV